MRVRTTLTGTTSLMVHNVQLANPDGSWSKQISAITSKRKKTEEDRREIARLEWLGSLYTHENQLVIPTTNVRKCFQEAAKVTKQGKQVLRAVNLIEQYAPLVYGEPRGCSHDRPHTPDALWEHEEFRDITVVGVGQSRTPRCRPIFKAGWGTVIDWELITDIMDLEDFQRLAALAGRIEGLGDNRTGGYGRFEVEVESRGD